MSALSEDSPTNPQDPLHYARRRTGTRPDVRLSTVSTTVGETPFDRLSRPEVVRRASPPPLPSLSAELEHAVAESLRRQMDPEVVPEPPGLEGRGWRRAWLGVGTAVVIAAIAATLLVTLTSREDPGASLVASSSTQDDAAKPALAQFRSLIVASDGEQAVTREQSEKLLQQFMLWRQKVGAEDQAR